MGITRTDLYTSEQNTLATFAKVLGHPARIAILQHLLKIQACICGDLVDEIGLAQATISQHLKELKNIGIIHGSIEGNSICYCINNKKWHEIRDILMKFFEMGAGDDACC
jgi:DNA-binding transcriptional ArsR family regulator